MENSSKNIRFLGVIFILVSIFYSFYAACSQIGLYHNGAYYFLHIFENILNNKFSFSVCDYHPRAIVEWILEIPAVFSGVVLGIKSKTTLATIYSFTMLLLPLLALWWNCELTKRTKETAILFWSVLTYCLFLLPFHISSSTESIVGIPFQFVLLNYLYGKINYTKADKIGIAFIILMMFGIYEHTIALGVIIFAGMFIAAFNESDAKNMLVKIWIGAGALASAFYSFFFLIFHSVKKASVLNFATDLINVFPNITTFSFIISAITIILLTGTLIFQRNKSDNRLLLIFSLIYAFLFMKMCTNLHVFLNPDAELQTRGIVCVVMPLIFLGIVLKKYGYFRNIKADADLCMKNAYIPVLLCGITLTAWQIVNTYYWNENMECFKNEINEKIASPVISEEDNAKGIYNLKRYIPESDESSIRTLIDNESAVNSLYFSIKNNK